MEIKGFCYTNLDGFDCSKQKSFVAIPNKGDSVIVTYRGEPARLEVCSITHSMKDGAPIISVELTGRPRE